SVTVPSTLTAKAMTVWVAPASITPSEVQEVRSSLKTPSMVLARSEVTLTTSRMPSTAVTVNGSVGSWESATASEIWGTIGAGVNVPCWGAVQAPANSSSDATARTRAGKDFKRGSSTLRSDRFTIYSTLNTNLKVALSIT